MEPSTGRNRVFIPSRQATQAGEIGSLESILVLLKSLKIRALQSWRLFSLPAPHTSLSCLDGEVKEQSENLPELHEEMDISQVI
jgi:hypothetical protein